MQNAKFFFKSVANCWNVQYEKDFAQGHLLPGTKSSMKCNIIFSLHFLHRMFLQQLIGGVKVFFSLCRCAYLFHFFRSNGGTLVAK
jgi:hypothetical protein